MLATGGLLVSAVGLLGLSTVVATTPYWLIALYMVLMGGGSGLFTSPNVNALMSTVPPRQRGTASGISTMVANTGQMLSIAIAFPLVLSRIPEDVMFKVFLYGGGMGDVPEALHAFEAGPAPGVPGVVRHHPGGRAGLGAAPVAQPARSGCPGGVAGRRNLPGNRAHVDW